MTKFLRALLVVATGPVPETWLRQLDRYFRRERHGDRADSESGYAMVVRLCEERYLAELRRKAASGLAFA
jgi:hypothetical protein